MDKLNPNYINLYTFVPKPLKPYSLMAHVVLKTQ